MGIQLSNIIRPITAKVAYDLFKIPRSLLATWRDDPDDDLRYSVESNPIKPEFTIIKYELADCCQRRLDGGDPEEWRARYPEGGQL